MFHGIIPGKGQTLDIKTYLLSLLIQHVSSTSNTILINACIWWVAMTISCTKCRLLRENSQSLWANKM